MSGAGLSAIQGGYNQGQDQLAQIRLKAQQIQQNQMALDQMKQQLRAQAFSIFGSGGMGGAPQAAPPTTASPASPAGPGGQQPPAQVGMPGATPMPQAQGPSPTGAMPGGAAMQPQGGAATGGAPVDDYSPMGEFQTVQRIAQMIRAQNPGIDNQSLQILVNQALEMMKGVSATARPAVSLIGAQTRADTAQTVQGMRDTTAQTVQGMKDTTAEDVTSQKDQTEIQKATIAANASMQKAMTVQDRITARFNAGQSNKMQQEAQTTALRAATAKLANATRILTSAANAVTPVDPSILAKAQKDAAEATATINHLASLNGVQGGEAGGAQGPSTAPPGAGGLPLVSSDADYQALKKGQQYQYMGPDGKLQTATKNQ